MLSIFINYFEKVKGMRWGTPNESVEGVDFDEVFEAEGFNVVRFLKMDNVVDEVKRQNQKVTEKLVGHTGILRDLMIICMKPHAYNNPALGKLTNEHTHKAIEILTSLTQQFSDFLLSVPESKEKPDDDQVVTEDVSPAEDSPVNPLFLELVSLLEEEKPLEETALSYLVKIATSLSYQKPRQVIIALLKTGNIGKNIFQHFYSRSIYEWFTRLLQIEDSSSFYEKQKLMLFKQCINAIQSEDNVELLLEKLENYESIFAVLLQKIDDRFDKAKFSSMVKQLLAEQDCLACLFNKVAVHPANSQILEQILSIFQVYLRFSSNHRSMNAIRNSQNLESSIYQIRLNSDLIKDIKGVAKSKSGELLSQNSSKTLARRYLQMVRAIIIFDSDFVQEIINANFVQQLIQIIVKNPNNNILHNLVKDILIESLNRSYQHTVSILLNEEGHHFIQILRECRLQNAAKSIPYQNQLFHIFQAVIKKGEDNSNLLQNLIKKIQGFEEIVSRMKEKQKFYSKLIGGNARKESSCWGDSSAEIVFEKILPHTSDSDKKIELNPNADYIEGNQNEHWFDCGGLPLDSDSSRDEASGNLDIENCLSPRSPTNFGKNLQILPVNEQQDFPLRRENSDIRIVIQLGPQGELIQLHNNSDLCIEPEELLPNKDEPDGRSFNTFFVTYESFQLDEVLSEIE